MRTLFFLLALFCLAHSSFAQTDSVRLLSKQDYLQRSQRQKKTARILLAAGGSLVLTALLIPRGEVTYPGICVFGFCDEERKNDKLKSVIGTIGGVAALGSIPFFVVSKKNSRKAASVGLRLEQGLQLRNRDFAVSLFPALQLSIRL